MQLITWIERHKDFFLAIAALLAPFAAVFIGLVASRMQATSLMEATRMQIQASALRDYRQRNMEKLREELAAQIFYVMQLRRKQQELGIDDAKAQELIHDAVARKIRIRSLASPLSRELLDVFFDCEDFLLQVIRSNPAGQSWGPEENTDFDKRMLAFENCLLKVFDLEMQIAPK